MIFVTVGTSTPFDRLIRTIDEWAGSRKRDDVFAQIGLSDYKPKNIEAVKLLNPADFSGHFNAAQFVVAHAGMGTIITALEIGKPLVILPRRAHFNETRNDHQFATAQQFSRQRGIIVALNEEELIHKLDQADIAPVTSQIGSEASPGLISALRSFIEEAGTAKRR
jgi:UDP-N-acetylglucosamine transferase subunit ALG13